MLNLSNNPPEQQPRFSHLKQLLHKHPFLFCGGLWITLVFVGSVATLGLFNPGPIETDSSRPLPPVTTFEESTPQSVPDSITKPAPPEPSSTKQDVPLFLFAAIALGCAGGSFLLTQMLRYSAERRSPEPRSKSVGTIRKKGQKPTKKRRSASTTPQQVSSQPNVPKVNNHLVKTEKQLARITVLPPEQSNPLDGNKENLAEMMDLRKRYSIKALMRNK